MLTVIKTAASINYTVGDGGGGVIKVEDLSCSVSCDLSQRLILSHKFLYELKKKKIVKLSKYEHTSLSMPHISISSLLDK